MKAIRKKPGEKPEIVDIENNLESLQKAVGGYIECIPYDKFIVICDEEGRLKGKPFNCVIDPIPYVGTILAVGDDGEDFKDIEISLADFNGRMAWI